MIGAVISSIRLSCHEIRAFLFKGYWYNLIHDLSFQVETCDGTSMRKINNMMYQETPYKTIQRTKYIVQVVGLVCKLAAMSEKNSVFIFSNEGSPSSKRLTNHPDMIDKLVDCCNERLSLGQSYIKQLSDRLASLSESERKCVRYHRECRKPIVNMSMIAWLRSKRVRSDSPVDPYVLRDRLGRPINTTDYARPKRTKSTPKSQGVCILIL